MILWDLLQIKTKNSLLKNRVKVLRGIICVIVCICVNFSFLSVYADDVLVGEEEIMMQEEDLNPEDYEESENIDNISIFAADSYSGSLNAGKFTKRNFRSLKKGNKVTLTLKYSPSSKVQIGLVEPDSTLRYVNKSGNNVSYTFTIRKTGTHKIYIKNNGSKKITYALKASY